MTSPSGSDPNYPQGGAQGQPGWSAPQGQPGWSAPQEPPAGYSPAGYGAPAHDPAESYGGPDPAARRPGQVTGAAVVGIVWGAIGGLLSIVVMLGAFALGVPVAGLVFLLSAALYVGLLVAGVQVLQGRSPRLLLLLSYVAIGLSVLSLVLSLVSTGGEVYSGLLGIVVPGVIVFLLMQPQSKQYFAARGLRY